MSTTATDDPMTVNEVAACLGCHRNMVYAYAKAGVLSFWTRTSGPGRSHRKRFDPGEVLAFKAGGVVAAAQYRAKKARGRKVKA